MPLGAQQLATPESGFADVLRSILLSNSEQAMPDDDVLTNHGQGLGTTGFANWNISCLSHSDEDFLAFDIPMEDAIDPRDEITPHNTPFATVAQAFKASVWNWVPASHDSWTSEQDKLAIPVQGLNHAHVLHAHNPPQIAQQLQQSDRDRILAVVLKTCQKANISKIASNFPSCHILEILLQVFLQCHISQNDGFIHVPTFQASNTRPELLVAMIAAGGVLTSVRPLQKLGYAWQEVIRPACADQVVPGLRFWCEYRLIETTVGQR